MESDVQLHPSPSDRAAGGERPAKRRRRPRLVSIRDAATAYLFAIQGHATRETIRTYRDGLNTLCVVASLRQCDRLEDLSPLLVRQAVAHCLDPTVPHHPNWKGGEAKARVVVTSAQGMVTWLVAEGVPVNAAILTLTKPKVPERIQPRVHADDYQQLESAALRRLVDRKKTRFVIARDFALIQFCLDTGLRAIELARLCIKDVNLATGVVTVHEGKGRKPRILSIADPDESDGGSTLRALRDYVDHLHDRGVRDDFGLWVSHYGRHMRPSAVRDVLMALRKEAGLPHNLPPHAFRRTMFTESYQENPMGLPRLVQRMGWSPKSRNLIDTYTRGAEMEMGGSLPQPSLAKRWRTKTRPPTSDAGKQNRSGRAW